MEPKAPKYRVSTIEPVSKAEVAVAFDGYLSANAPGSALWLCSDGTEVLFRPSAESERFFVEFRCQFHSGPAKSVNYGLLPRVVEFCRAHGGSLKVVRSGSVLAASGGIYSDVFHSKADRVAQHLAQHPKDRKAVERYAKRDGV